MSRSTPINQIRRNEQNNDSQMSGSANDNQLIDDILREMGESPGLDNQGDINVNSLQYTMDNSQVPPERIAHNKFDELSKNMNQEAELSSGLNLSSSTSSSSNSSSNTNNSINVNNNDMLSNLNLKLNGTSDLKSKIINFVKIPIIVFILTFIFGLPYVNRFIFRFLPKLLHESGQITIGGILLKSAIITIIVMLFQYFL